MIQQRTPRLRARLSRRDFLRFLVGTGMTLSLVDAWPGLLPVAAASATGTPRRNVGDVLRFSTRPQGWKGLFGFVTFRLHPAFFAGRRAYHIRSDTSDAGLAKRVGLVHVPKLDGALKAGLTGDYYLFANGAAAGQLPVVSTVPGRGDYTPVFRLLLVAFTRSARLLTSAAAIHDAQAAGLVTIRATDIAVNYPFVKWPEGELPQDTRREAYLGEGQLLQRPDLGSREVSFKLHQCFPGEWYIVTDVSVAPMAPMMRIIASPRSHELTQARATAKILVFGNGLTGPGPMGFQPSIVDSIPGNPVWSPFWDHYTFTWQERSRPAVVRNQSELLDLEDQSAVKRWPGTPDTGQLFVVNCPVPVTAPVTWRP